MRLPIACLFVVAGCGQNGESVCKWQVDAVEEAGKSVDLLFRRPGAVLTQWLRSLSRLRRVA